MKTKKEDKAHSQYFFVADEHYGHENIVKKYGRDCFSSIEEHDETLIMNHNKIVEKSDITIHAGDFTLLHNKEKIYKNYINRLKGNHIFLRGSHDYWLPKTHQSIWEKEFKDPDAFIVVCHYAMRHWARSHYNSYQVYGHAHNGLPTEGKQWCISINTNLYYPYSLDQIIGIIKDLPDNINMIKKRWN